LIQITFSVPSGFLVGMMTPLDFVHFNHFPSSDPLLSIKNLDRIFNIREVRFYQYFLLFNNFGRNSNTLLELRDMKDIMDGYKRKGELTSGS
jgi:hypothetical protein